MFVSYLFKLKKKLPQYTCMLDSVVCECITQPHRWDLFTYVSHNKKTLLDQIKRWISIDNVSRLVFCLNHAYVSGDKVQ